MGIFSEGLFPLENNEAYLRRFVPCKLTERIQKWFQYGSLTNHIFYGLRGTGKTTLINLALSDDFRHQLAAEKKILIQDCHFGSGCLRGDADVFKEFLNAVEESLFLLYGTENYERLSEALSANRRAAKYDNYSDEVEKYREMLKESLRLLRQNGYRATLIIEDFHLLTCSKNCATSTFSNIALLTQSGHLSLIVITDFHIKVGSKEYGLSEFSRIFNNIDPLRPEPIKKEQVPELMTLVNQKVREEMEDYSAEKTIQFSLEEIEQIYELSGGIPGLMADILSELYEFKKQNSKITPGIITSIADEGCFSLFNAWYSHLSEGHIKVLRLFDGSSNLSEFEQKVQQFGLSVSYQELKDMALLRTAPGEEQKLTIRANCPLFEINLPSRLLGFKEQANAESVKAESYYLPV